MHVPATPEQLDTAWLREALAPVLAFAGVEVVGVEARRIGVGYGLDGTLVHLDLETERGAPGSPRSLVAKLSPYPRGREEVEFYEQVAPHMPVRLPRYYRGITSDEDERAVLLLEDLTTAVQGDCLVGASRSQAEAALRATARFHAAFLGGEHPALATRRHWTGPDAEFAAKLEARLPRFLERYAAHVDPRTLALLPELPGRLPEIRSRLHASETTLVHTDLHLDNVLYLADGTAVILDWPDARVGPAALDVGRIFVEGLSLEMRRAHGPALLEVYKAARAEAGAPCPPKAAWADAEHAAVLSHLAYAAAWGGAEDPGFQTPRVREIVDTLVRSTAAAAADL